MYFRCYTSGTGHSMETREKWLPFSSWRNVRRGQALRGKREAQRHKGKAEYRSMQFAKCSQAEQGETKHQCKVSIYGCKDQH